MRFSATFILIALLSLLLAGCCLKFSDLNAGASYSVGETITTSGKNIVVERFQWGDGVWTSSGTARVDTRNYAGGSGHDLNARNVNLHFLLDYPLEKLAFSFGELGGNNNISVNGDFRNVNDLVSLDGSVVGGVQIIVTASQEGNNWYGEMVLEGTINDFTIGGQELWIDDICPTGGGGGDNVLIWDQGAWDGKNWD